MKIKSERDKRNYIIIGLCMILVVMGVGYAAFSSLLTINGTANISNSWCVGFDNTKTNAYVPKAGITGATAPTGSIGFSGTACGTNLVPASSLTAHFYQPGDEIEYTLTIVNKSSVTAAIKSILVDNESVTSNTTKKKGNITYIVNMPESTTLAPNASTTMKVIARFQNETDVTGNVNGQTETIEVKINTEQDDGTGGFTPAPTTFTGTIYRNNTSVLVNGLPMNGEVTIYYPSSGFSSAEEAKNAGAIFGTSAECTAIVNDSCSSGTVTLSAGDYSSSASTLNKPYYLKHEIVNDIVTASYVCFVTDTEHCMQGGNSSYYAANKTLLQEQELWFNNNGGSCSFGDDASSCGSSALDADTNSVGTAVAAASVSGNCAVSPSGSSSCYVSSSGTVPDFPVFPDDPVDKS